MHVIGRLSLIGVGREPLPQLLDGLSPETRQTSVQHQRDQRHDSLAVRPETKGKDIEFKLILFNGYGLGRLKVKVFEFYKVCNHDTRKHSGKRYVR